MEDTKDLNKNGPFKIKVEKNLADDFKWAVIYYNACMYGVMRYDYLNAIKAEELINKLQFMLNDAWDFGREYGAKHAGNTDNQGE